LASRPPGRLIGIVEEGDGLQTGQRSDFPLLRQRDGRGPPLALQGSRGPLRLLRAPDGLHAQAPPGRPRAVPALLRAGAVAASHPHQPPPPERSRPSSLGASPTCPASPAAVARPFRSSLPACSWPRHTRLPPRGSISAA